MTLAGALAERAASRRRRLLVIKVLVIDSDQAMVRALSINLRARGYDARSAETGGRGLVVAGRYHPDCVLLDPGVPDMNGLDAVAGLRGWSSVPIIIISRMSGEQDTVAALDAGADDYLAKPFGMSELFARLRALVRRSRRPDEVARVTTDHFTVDLSARRVTTVAGDVRLTPTEWRLIEVLVRNAGKVVTQQALLREVWGPEYETETHYLRVYLTQIRRKLEPNPCEPRYFLTHPGIGLRFDKETVGSVALDHHRPLQSWAAESAAPTTGVGPSTTSSDTWAPGAPVGIRPGARERVG
jgi:two-component system KDP operon response regulator KdpE